MYVSIKEEMGAKVKYQSQIPRRSCSSPMFMFLFLSTSFPYAC